MSRFFTIDVSHIYINKVAVCVFVLKISFTIVIITQVLVHTFTTRGKTTYSITYFVMITQVLVQTFNTRGKYYSSSSSTR